MRIIQYNVPDLLNAQSKTQLRNALDKVIGVQEVAVDFARGIVQVGYNPPADGNQIKMCIENTGYSVE